MGGRRLADDEALCALGGGSVAVVDDAVAVTLVWEAEETALGGVRHGTAFQSVLGRAETALGRALPLDTVFECQCGRRLSRENQWTATVARDCCDGVEKRWTVRSPRDVSVRMEDEACLTRTCCSEPPELPRLVVEAEEPREEGYVAWRLRLDLQLLLRAPGGGLARWRVGRDERVGDAVRRLEAERGRRIRSLDRMVGPRREPMEMRRRFRQLQTPQDAVVEVVEEPQLSQFLPSQSCQESDDDSIEVGPSEARPAKTQQEKTRDGPSPEVTWSFNVDCRQAGGRRDFHLAVSGAPPAIDVAQLRQRLFDELGRRDLLLVVQRGWDADSRQMVETVDGWRDSDGNEVFLSDLVEREWTVLEDGMRISMTHGVPVCLRVVHEAQRDDLIVP